MEKENKREFKLENSLYKERFQFILQINENIICQRFFRINGFTNKALNSREFTDVMNEAVGMIQDDLVSKSRIYEWYTTPSPLKMTGFVNDLDKYTEAEKQFILHDNCDGILHCENGDIINKTYLDYTKIEDTQVEERPEDGEFVFKFLFLVDDKVVYERIWDGNVYPKYVRNSVDLTNSDIAYRDKDPMTLPFSLAIIRHMTIGKEDLTYHIIKKICNTLGSSYIEEYGEYTDKETWGKDSKGKTKTYSYSKINYDMLNDWRNATKKKTRDYLNSILPSQKQLNYIDKYL